jgi:hypothetical protein
LPKIVSCPATDLFDSKALWYTSFPSIYFP